MASYSDFTPSILPYVPGCPDMTVERYLARVVTDFFERTQAWQVNLVGGTTNTPFVVLTSGIPVDCRLTHCYELRYQDSPLDPSTVQNMFRSYPSEGSGNPRLFVMRDDDALVVLPYPADVTAGEYAGRGAVTPKLENTALPDLLYDKYEEALVFGTLARLQMMPQQDWTNVKLAGANMSLYEGLLLTHKRQLRRKRHATNGSRHVAYGGLLG